jgi:hypothetical protein
MIVDAPWYVPNTVIQRDIQTPTVKEEVIFVLAQVVVANPCGNRTFNGSAFQHSPQLLYSSSI